MTEKQLSTLVSVVMTLMTVHILATEDEITLIHALMIIFNGIAVIATLEMED